MVPRYPTLTLDLERVVWRPVSRTSGVALMIMDIGSCKPVQLGVVDAIAAAICPDGSVGVAVEIEIGAQVHLPSELPAGQIGQLAWLDDGERSAALLELMEVDRLVTAPASAVLPISG